MEKCLDCGSKLKEIDFSKSKAGYKHDSKKHGRAFKCSKCNTVYFDESTSKRLSKEIEKATKDKLIKVDEETWNEVKQFVKTHKRDYPSMKFFTQKALLEKLSREH